MHYPKTLQEAIKYFADEQTCINEVAAMRWPDGVVSCSGCGLIGECIWLANQKRWKCRGCKKQISVKVGTIFHDSPLGLDKWLMAMWLIANCKNGVSSYEIARFIGVTQKSAWHMMHRIRKAMKEGDPGRTMGQSGKPVEVDETYIGGKAKNKHVNKRKQDEPKTIVMGMLDRDARKVRAKVIPTASRQVLQAEILASIVKVGTVYTDGLPGYDHLTKARYIHETVNHMNEYVRGDVHTQGIENFWSLLKRGLSGTYVAVEPFHLERYVDEQVFRYNHRHHGQGDAGRFKAVLKDVVGRRLTYAELTGREGSEAF